MEDNIFEQYAELVRRVKAGDEYAFTELFEKSKRLVYATCYGILNNQQDAEEAMLDTYLAVSQNINTLDDEYTFLHWLKTIASNKARDKFKARKGDLSYDDAVESGEDLEGDDNLETLPDSLIMEKTKRDTLLGIIRKELSDVQFQTVFLYYYNELSYADISKIMCCPEETVKSRLKSSRIKIKAGIKEYEKVNKDSLMAGAASVPFLSRLFTEFADDLKVPSVNPFPSKNAAGPKGNQVKADAAKATAKSLSEKAVVQTGAKATLAGASGLKMTAIIVGAVVGIGAIGGAIFGISRLISENTAETSEETEEVVIVETEETEAGPLSVDVNVMVFDGHSYALYDNCSSWEDAEAYCESVGGHLAVITSQEENDAVFAYAQSCGCDNVYIGYSDISNEGVWEWVNGESSDFTNWNEGEPNAFTPDENYAVMAYNGGWNDCTYAPAAEGMNAVYVCEWDSEVIGLTNVSAIELIESEDENTADGTEESGHPVVVPLDQIPDLEQLSGFISYWTWPFAAHNLPDHITSILVDGPSVDLTLYFDGDPGLDDRFTDPSNGAINKIRLDISHLEWVEENILNFAPETIDFIHDRILEGDNLGLWSVVDEYIYLNAYPQAPSQNDIQEIEFDGNYYYVHSVYDDSFEGMTDLYYTMEYIEIDGVMYWTLIDCNDTGFNYDTVPVNSDPLAPNWEADYSYEVFTNITIDSFDGLYYDHNIAPSPMMYDLIDINGDDIPELLCSVRYGSEVYINLYTWSNGEVIKLGDTLRQTNIVFTYIPGQNQISLSYSAGDELAQTYYGINDSCDALVITRKIVQALYDINRYRSSFEVPSDELFDDWVYYRYDFETGEYVQLTDAEYRCRYEAYVESNSNSVALEGTMTYDEIYGELNK